MSPWYDEKIKKICIDALGFATHETCEMQTPVQIARKVYDLLTYDHLREKAMEELTEAMK